eukprot:jgi/Botrbrau1/20799/Bobra.0156s0028.1
MEAMGGSRVPFSHVTQHLRFLSVVCYAGKPNSGSFSKSRTAAVSSPARPGSWYSPSSRMDVTFLGVPGVDFAVAQTIIEGDRTVGWEASTPADGVAGPCLADDQRGSCPPARVVTNARYAAQLRGSARRGLDREQRRWSPSQRGRSADSRTRPRRPRTVEKPASVGILPKDDEATYCLAVQELARIEAVRKDLSSEGDQVISLDRWADAAGVPAEQLLHLLEKGEAALKKLEAANMGLIKKSVSKIKAPGIAKEDLIFEAKAGLRSAVIRFDPSRKAPLFPLASLYIKKHLYALVEQQSKPIVAPKGGHEKLMKLNRIQKELEAQLGRPPTVELVAARAGITLTVAQALLKWKEPVGDYNKLVTIGKLNEQNDKGGDEVLAELDDDGNVKEDGDEQLIDEELLRKAYMDVELMMDLLPDERDRQIVSMRYGLTDGQCKSFKEIATSLPEPISSGFARTVFVRAMSRLRELKFLMDPVSVAV